GDENMFNVSGANKDASKPGTSILPSIQRDHLDDKPSSSLPTSPARVPSMAAAKTESRVPSFGESSQGEPVQSIHMPTNETLQLALDPNNFTQTPKQWNESPAPESTSDPSLFHTQIDSATLD